MFYLCSSDLAKFRHLGQVLKSLANISKDFLTFEKNLNLLAHFHAIGKFFNFCKWPNFEKLVQPSGHTAQQKRMHFCSGFAARLNEPLGTTFLCLHSSVYFLQSNWGKIGAQCVLRYIISFLGGATSHNVTCLFKAPLSP